MSLPMTPFERIMKKIDVGRVSKEALEEMREAIEEYAESIAEQSVRLARHSNRKTVLKHDIEFVSGVKDERENKR